MTIKFVTKPPTQPSSTPAEEKGSFYVSATSAHETASPAVKAWLPYVDGRSSPLGANGPLSAVKRIGTVSAGGPADFIAKAAATKEWKDSLALTPKNQDFFSNDYNPVGAESALNEQRYLGAMFPLYMTAAVMPGGLSNISTIEALQPGGTLGIAGRGGINNAAGWMGALGPTGAYAMRGLHVKASTGDYVDAKGKVVGEIDNVKWDDTESRSLPLVEKYSASRAKALSDAGKLDASWMVDQAIKRDGDSVTYKFTAPKGQFLNLVVLPADQDSAQATLPNTKASAQSDFDLEVLNSKGEVIANSIQRDGNIDWIQMYNPEQKELSVRVKLHSHSTGSQGRETKFRLVVDTATDKVKPVDTVHGAHQLKPGTLAVEE